MNLSRYFSKTQQLATLKKVEIEKENKPYFEAIKQFEQNKYETERQKAKLFIWFSIGELVVIALLAVAIAMMLPLKTVEAWLVRVDNLTGYTDMARPLGNAKMSYEEASTQHLLWQYVINYESYDWETISEMSDIVKTMSSDKIFSSYDTAVRADNGPLNVLKDNYRMKVKIKGVTFLKPDIAQVRFSKIIIDSSGKPAPEYHQTEWMATISFNFAKKIEKAEQQDVNPLGMQVLSYRVDPETIK